MRYLTPTTQQLIEAQRLIASPTSWTRSVYAKDANGEEVDPDDEQATCWCSLGAIAKVTDTDPNTGWFLRPDIEQALIDTYYDVPDWNDNPNTTHADVMAGFDRAIAKAKELECNS